MSKNWCAVTGLTVGALSAFLYPIGIIPLASIGLSALGIFWARRHEGVGLKMAWLGLGLGCVYFLMNLNYWGHVGPRFVTSGQIDPTATSTRPPQIEREPSSLAEARPTASSVSSTEASLDAENRPRIRELQQRRSELFEERQRLQGLADGTLYDVTDPRWRQEESLRLAASRATAGERPERAAADERRADRLRESRLADAAQKLELCEAELRQIEGEIRRLSGLPPKDNADARLTFQEWSAQRSRTPREQTTNYAGSSTNCAEGNWIDSVAGDGRIVILDDESVWEVDSLDRYDSKYWSKFDDVIACDDKLINVDEEEFVAAKRLR